MTSFFNPKSQASSHDFNCTTASCFERAKSLRFELLFGCYKKRVSQTYSDENIIDAFDYLFLPNDIFGFSYSSTGQDYKKFHHMFILRSCFPGERGSLIPGISPGAEILVKALTISAINQLRGILGDISKNKIDFSKIEASQYKKLNNLLDISAKTNYFVGEMIARV